MGAGVSAGKNNDELIDNLIEANYIRTPSIARVFRAVDRGAYFVNTHPQVNAYRDVAWKFENYHISAPCIYSEVMEGLKLEPGLSFLNLGSGTGYLSTMAGLILGHNGINHGIELHEDVVLYANKKLEEFKRYSGAIDEFDFCEPKFIQGNCLSIDTASHHQYDRVYCGAACPESYLNYIKNLLKIGGILIIPLHEQLLQMIKTSDRNWSVESLLPVSFASMIEPIEGKTEMVKLFDIEPLTLQELCRATVRNILRKIIEKEHPPVVRETKKIAPKKKRALRRFVVPVFDDESDNETRVVVFRNTNNTRDTSGRVGFRSDLRRESKKRSTTTTKTKTTNDLTNMEIDSGTTTTTTTTTDDDQPKTETIIQKVKAVIEHQPEDNNETLTTQQQHDEATTTTTKPHNNNNNSNEKTKTTDESSLDVSEIQDVLDKLLRKRRKSIKVYRKRLTDRDDEGSDEEKEEEEQPTTSNENKIENKDEEDSDEGCDITSCSTPLSYLSAPGHIVTDDIIPCSTPISYLSAPVDIFTGSSGDSSGNGRSSSDDEEQEGKRVKKSRNNKNEKRMGCKWRKTDKNINIRHGDNHETDDEANSSNEEEEEEKECQNVKDQLKMYKSPYTEHMKNKILKLPLPSILKSYFNFYRDF